MLQAALNWLVTPREGGLSNLDRRITSASGSWSYGSQAGGCGLEKACHSTGSLDPNWGRQGRGVCSGSK